MSGLTTTSPLSAHPRDDLAAVSVDELLAPHDVLLDRIRTCYGVDAATFERDILCVVRGYAAFVHLLPATPSNFFSAPGGLLQLGLEIGFFALQGTDAHIFSGRATISARRHLEPRWRLATFIAGLCCEVHRALSPLCVTAPSGREWPGFVKPMAQWLADEQIARYSKSWRPDAPLSRAAGVFTLRLILPPDTLQHLADGNAVIVPHLLSSLSGVPVNGQHNVLDELVRRSAAVVIDRHLQTLAVRTGEPVLGDHLERYLVDAMRRLVSTNAAWTANADRSRVWHSAEGLFIVWPGAATDIRKLFDAEQMPGMPREPEAMLRALVTAGLVDLRDDGTALWPITPPGTKTALEAIKLAAVATVYPGLAEAPVAIEAMLLASSAQKPAQPADDRSPPPGLALDAPMRLDRAVRQALDAFLSSLNADPARLSEVGAPTGLFVPLAEFVDRSVQAAIAIRALSDAKMLAQGDTASGPTAQRTIGGQPATGIVVHARHVTGYMPPAAAGTPQQGS